MLIKVLAEETTLNAATNVGSATVVRLYNGHSAALLITRKDSSSAIIGSVTVKNGETVLLEKDASDTLTAASNGSSVKVVKIAYGI